MSLLVKLYSTIYGKAVGKDSFGNKYYCNNVKTDLGDVEKRWVVYKGIREGSKVPPEWESWLRGVTNTKIEYTNKTWNKPHLPNLTGTIFRHYLGKNITSESPKPKSKPYTSWKPNS